MVEPIQKNVALSNYFIPNVLPLADTGQTLGPGKYCLGVDSTIPFVNFIGGGNVNKIFSWGEMIEVPKGQIVKVKNASYMAGDIVINCGHDYAAKPARISTPISFVSVDSIFGLTTVKTMFPADTRLCRRAYLAIQIATDLQPVAVQVIGIPKKHSFPATYNNTSFPQPPASYGSTTFLPPLSIATKIALGYTFGNADLDLPMALTDQAEVYFGIAPGDSPILNSLAMYILEY